MIEHLAAGVEDEALSARELRVLRLGAAAFAVGFLLHNGDHLRRGIDSVTPQLFWVGNLGAVLSLVTMALVAVGHRLAPQVAAATCLPLALGFAAAHLAPHWSALSDPYPGHEVGLFSWVAALAEIGGALALGVAALVVLRGRRS